MLKMRRLAAVAVSSVAFMQAFVARGDIDPTRDAQSLETLADAMISMEYYLGEMERRHLPDDSILGIAEEALQQLGYPVATAEPEYVAS